MDQAFIDSETRLIKGCTIQDLLRCYAHGARQLELPNVHPDLRDKYQTVQGLIEAEILRRAKVTS